MKASHKVWKWAKEDLGLTAKSLWGLSLELGQRLELAKGLNRRLERLPLTAKSLKGLNALVRPGFGQAARQGEESPRKEEA